jgi:DNA-binding transcriptional MerR regulator
MSDTKSESAFRTISEVAQLLDVKPHVLRFWESKFDQIQPMKRANGRRYYRPEDVALISGIQHLLYEQGLTIKGVQKLIKDDGIASVRAQRQSLMQARLLLAD